MVPREIPVDATMVHLDGNSFPVLAPESFLGRSKLTKLFLNGSSIMGIVTFISLGLHLIIFVFIKV